MFLEKLLDVQEKTRAKKRILLIFDDILDAQNACHQSKLLSHIFTTHRHFNLSVMISTQHATGVSPTVRENCDFAFCHFSKNKDIKEMFRRTYLSSLNPPEFDQLLSAATANYNVLILFPLDHETDMQVFNARWD